MKKFIKDNWFKLCLLLLITISILTFFIYLFCSEKPETEKVINVANNLFEQNGNIFLSYQEGSTKQLTFSGLDSQPSLSHDKKTVAFLRNFPGKVYVKDLLDQNNQLPGLSDYDENGEFLNYGQIYIMELADLEEQKLLDSGKIGGYLKNGEGFLNSFNIISNIARPIFSADDTKIYFMASAWVTSNAIFSIDINTNQLSYITDGNSLNIINKGDFIGNIIVIKHKYYEDTAGSYDHYFIIDNSGKEIKDIGEWDNMNNVISEDIE